MSIKVMSAVYDSDLTDVYDVAVMLALANHADDDGICYPSIARIARLARMKPRGVQGVVKRLEERGYLSVRPNAGPSGTNLFQLTLPPAPHAPPHVMHPRTPCATPPHPVQDTPAPHAPETSGTIIETSVDDNARADAKPKKARLPEGWVPDGECMAYALSQKLNHDEIKEIADDFHAYWRDRTDAGGRKSERGWRQTWRNRVRDQAPKFIRNRRMAEQSSTVRHGQGGGIAGAVARRQFGGSA